MEYYKSLTADNKGPYTNFDFSDYLPKKGKPGKWLPVVKKLSLCQSGWHGCTTSQLIEWLNANIYEIEFRGKKKTGTQKICGEQIRFVRKVLGEYDLQVFACDCADHVLHLYEDKYPNDKRPREAIEARRKFAKGEITAVARDGAWAAAGAAAGAAARAAAWAAARAAARAAAWAAAGDAAWAAARAAAGDAAAEGGAGPWDVAGDAAGDAARAAAGDAAGDAARAAEKKWQVALLKKYICWAKSNPRSAR